MHSQNKRRNNDEFRRQLAVTSSERFDLLRTETSNPNPSDFFHPFESPDGVIFAFCTGCSILYELKPDEAVPMFALAGVPLQTGVGLYLELHGCGTCCTGDGSVLLRQAVKPPRASDMWK